ncbi:hypothetical protein DFH08DRAFT_250232 [Mycena albidolilacea]|uniref:Uncharacterized protein n=1 Tax=Mycena albidolilacea TaxID=1033008 RepID=A0AAD6ZTI3_9AGAR|nr:hypothetical protein DFH08DRAFT_250232 [Mycena albidolilacea]
MAMGMAQRPGTSTGYEGAATAGYMDVDVDMGESPIRPTFPTGPSPLPSDALLQRKRQRCLPPPRALSCSPRRTRRWWRIINNSRRSSTIIIGSNRSRSGASSLQQLHQQQAQAAYLGPYAYLHEMGMVETEMMHGYPAADMEDMGPLDMEQAGGGYQTQHPLELERQQPHHIEAVVDYSADLPVYHTPLPQHPHYTQALQHHPAWRISGLSGSTIPSRRTPKRSSRHRRLGYLHTPLGYHHFAQTMPSYDGSVTLGMGFSMRPEDAR